MSTQHKVLFGLGLANGDDQVSEMLSQARVADETGLDFVSVNDHPYFADRLDAYAMLGFVLGATTNVAAGVICTNLLSRPAPVLARTVTSLSAISGGRVILPLGSSGMEDETAALGITHLSALERAQALEEAITIIRGLSGGGDPLTFDGDVYQVTELAPAVAEPPPIWTGVGGRKALGVTGRHADGWIPPHLADWRSKLVAEKRPLINEAAAAAGRSPSDIGNVYLVTGDITEDGTSIARADDGRWNGGSIAEWVDEMSFAIAEAGAVAFNYLVPPGEIADDRIVNLWSQEVVPAVREAVAKEAAA